VYWPRRKFEAVHDARASSTIFEPWLGIIKDLRTALAQDPLPLEAIKELLAA
jgi:hypothetical protein